MKRIYRNREIEEIAEGRLEELQRHLGEPLSPPIPIDRLAEKILQLDFLWDEIDELPGETILGGLNPKCRLIVLNERHRSLFEEKPGLQRSTEGHEMGHWDLFVDQDALDQPTLFDYGAEGAFVLRSSRSSGAIQVLNQRAKSLPHPEEILRQAVARMDEPNEARAVNRYAAALSMPKEMMRKAAMRINRNKWGDLYRLSRKYEVTITALTVRLEQLGLLYVDENRKPHEAHDIAKGQMLLEI